MIYSKKAITAIAFIAGAATFITTAFADIAVGSGYDRLKNAIKRTSAQMSDGLIDNYSIKIDGIMKDNNNTIYEMSSCTKVDSKTGQKVETNSAQIGSKNRSNGYYYANNEMTIYKNGDNDKYRVIKHKDSNRDNKTNFNDPFKEKGAAEIEKVIDAVVGSLREYVQVKQTGDKKEYSGVLTETQIPAVANALSSFLFKKQFSRQHEVPMIESDVFIKSISGSALENKSGVLEALAGEIVFYGKDKEDVLHEMTFAFDGKVYDVGTTKIEKPDTKDAEIIEENEKNGPVIDKKYEGKYKQNIVIDKDGQLIKIGERVLEIISVSNNKVKGRYFETYKPGFESHDKHMGEINFDTIADDGRIKVSYKNNEGIMKDGEIFLSGQCNEIYVHLVDDKNGDQFTRDFGE